MSRTAYVVRASHHVGGCVPYGQELTVRVWRLLKFIDTQSGHGRLQSDGIPGRSRSKIPCLPYCSCWRVMAVFSVPRLNALQRLLLLFGFRAASSPEPKTTSSHPRMAGTALFQPCLTRRYVCISDLWCFENHAFRSVILSVQLRPLQVHSYQPLSRNVYSATCYRYCTLRSGSAHHHYQCLFHHVYTYSNGLICGSAGCNPG